MTDERPEPVLVLKPRGRLDVDSCGDLRQQLAAALSVGVDRIGVDLSEVTLLDQAAVDLLGGVARHLRKSGGDLVAQLVPAPLAATLRVHGLGHLLDSRRQPLRVVRGAGKPAPRGPERRLTIVPQERLVVPG